MNVDTEVFRHFGVRSNPFAPTVDANGNPIEPQLFARSLDPRRDDRLLKYYDFDVYDFEKNQIIRGTIQDRGFERFPHRDEFRPVMILVTGTSLSGRGSMVNLCLHAIAETHGVKPVVIPCEFYGYDASKNIKDIARRFITAWRRIDSDLAKDLQAQLKDTPDEPEASPAPYQLLFDDIRSQLPPDFDRPISLVVSGGDSFDFWPAIYFATRSLADYIIVETTRASEAKTSAENLQAEGENAVLVRAKTVTLAAAERFVNVRLSLEGLTDAVERAKLLEPDSLAVLYEPGSGNRDNREVRHSIGWLNATLQRAFSDHFIKLSEIVERQGPASLATLPSGDIRITRTSLWNAAQHMNNRGRWSPP